MKRSRALPPAVREYLLRDAAGDGHPRVAIDRLLADDENLSGAWRWLDNKVSPGHVLHFAIAALQAYPLASVAALSAKQRTAFRRIGGLPAMLNGRPTIGAAFMSRQSGRQSDFIRAFIVRLQQFGFPVDRHGVQEQIAAVASVLLDEPVESRHVSKLFREVTAAQAASAQE